jgi:hypothetical protein
MKVVDEKAIKSPCQTVIDVRRGNFNKKYQYERIVFGRDYSAKLVGYQLCI